MKLKKLNSIFAASLLALTIFGCGGGGTTGVENSNFGTAVTADPPVTVNATWDDITSLKKGDLMYLRSSADTGVREYPVKFAGWSLDGTSHFIFFETDAKMPPGAPGWSGSTLFTVDHKYAGAFAIGGFDHSKFGARFIGDMRDGFSPMSMLAQSASQVGKPMMASMITSPSTALAEKFKAGRPSLKDYQTFGAQKLLSTTRGGGGSPSLPLAGSPIVVGFMVGPYINVYDSGTFTQMVERGTQNRGVAFGHTVLSFIAGGETNLPLYSARFVQNFDAFKYVTPESPMGTMVYDGNAGATIDFNKSGWDNIFDVELNLRSNDVYANTGLTHIWKNWRDAPYGAGSVASYAYALLLNKDTVNGHVSGSIVIESDNDDTNTYEFDSGVGVTNDLLSWLAYQTSTLTSGINFAHVKKMHVNASLTTGS